MPRPGTEMIRISQAMAVDGLRFCGSTPSASRQMAMWATTTSAERAAASQPHASIRSSFPGPATRGGPGRP